MRELEFLPPWYPQARHRLQKLRIKALFAVLIAVAIAAWLGFARRNIGSAQAALASVDGQLVQSRRDVEELQVQLKLKEQLEVQRKIVARLGLPLEASRLIRTLDQLMPKEMSITELTLETEEVKPTAAANPNASAAQIAAAKTAASNGPVDRRLRAHLVAVAPSDVDLANFLAGLTSTPFFDVAPQTYARDKIQNGHVLRQFEVTFGMSLNPTPAE